MRVTSAINDNEYESFGNYFISNYECFRFCVIISILSLNSKSDDWEEFFFIYVLTCFIAALVQLVIEVIFLLAESFVEINLKTYLQLASIICVVIWGLSFWNCSNGNFQRRLSESFVIFIFFYIYSIGSTITDNCLYFSKLKKQ